jgi:hypothetical protein
MMLTMADVFESLGAKPRKRSVRFSGICDHAKVLGVSRIHLYYVLTGVRRSPRIEAYVRKNMSRAR